MPYMQRLTWSGVALHQGVLPGYPASHGCIRLPEYFAGSMWGASKLGMRVVVTRERGDAVRILASGAVHGEAEGSRHGSGNRAGACRRGRKLRQRCDRVADAAGDRCQRAGALSARLRQ